MNILFLSLLDFESIDEHNIYTDLLRAFYKNGHSIYVVSPVERKKRKPTYLILDNRTQILKLKIGNIQKTNMIEKGISTLTIESFVIKGIKKYFSGVKFDLVLYTTPPITLQKAVNYVKKRDSAMTYLMLKDIFPQNAVDMGMLSKSGLKGILYRYFRNKEKKLYKDSDYIGCMSEANVEYVIKHNLEVNREKIEICPNCIEPVQRSVTIVEKQKLREQMGIPMNKLLFVYGGNLGKPQGIPFLIECLKKAKTNDKVYFWIVGNGTEYYKVEKFIIEEQPQNVKLMKMLPKAEYENMILAADVGMLFLDYEFTIPNFPSRLLAYMDAELPVLAIVDNVTDVGTVIENGQFGWCCRSNSSDTVLKKIEEIQKTSDLQSFGKNAKKYLIKNYHVNVAYDKIMSHGEKNEGLFN